MLEFDVHIKKKQIYAVNFFVWNFELTSEINYFKTYIF